MSIRISPKPGSIWRGSSHWPDRRSGGGRRLRATAIACDPTNADAHNNLGLALMRQGRLVEAEAALRQALALRPDFALPHSNILFCLNYRPDATAEADLRRIPQLGPPTRPPADARGTIVRARSGTPGGGFASATFHRISASTPSRCSPSRCWRRMTARQSSCTAMPRCRHPDAVTERFRALADHWRSTVGLSDADLAERIRHDRIDVLVDLAGHTAGNRLLTFRAEAGAGAGELPARPRLHHRPVRHGCIPGRCGVWRRPARTPLFSERVDPSVAHSAGLCTASGHAGCRAVARAGQRLRHVRLFRSHGAAERRRPGRLGAHPAARAGVAADAEQRAVRRGRRARTDGGPLRSARHRCVHGCTLGLHLATAADLGGVWRDRHCARPVSAQCRHHNDRGVVAGRSGRHARRPADRRPLRRVRSCTPSAWTTG